MLFINEFYNFIIAINRLVMLSYCVLIVVSETGESPGQGGSAGAGNGSGGAVVGVPRGCTGFVVGSRVGVCRVYACVF